MANIATKDKDLSDVSAQLELIKSDVAQLTTLLGQLTAQKKKRHRRACVKPCLT